MQPVQILQDRYKTIPNINVHEFNVGSDNLYAAYPSKDPRNSAGFYLQLWNPNVHICQSVSQSINQSISPLKLLYGHVQWYLSQPPRVGILTKIWGG
jgi:hypothetical protein